MLASRSNAVAAAPRSAVRPFAAARPAFARRVCAPVRALKVGDKLPEFELETDASTPASKATLSTKDIASSGAVIFVYPKACTSGCTLQANGFKDNAAAFAAKGYAIFGLSADAPEAQAGWKEQHGFGYPLLSDPDMAALRALGCVSAEGKITRAHFVVAKGGVVEDAQVGVGSKDSVPLALAFVSKL